MICSVSIYGNPVLKKKAEQIDRIDSGIRRLAQDMFETMYHYNGVGLAGPQIGVSSRIFTVNPRDPEIGEMIFINPKITDKNGKESAEEGCLSLPNIYGEVERANTITVSYVDIEGREQTEEFSGLMARIVQHETDHLNGVLFIDRMSENDRNALGEQLRILKKERKELEKLGPKIIDKSQDI